MYRYLYLGRLHNRLFACALLYPHHSLYVHLSRLVCYLPLLCRHHSVHLPLPQLQHQNRVKNIYSVNCVPHCRVLLRLRATADSFLQVFGLHIRRGYKPVDSFGHSTDSQQQAGPSLDSDCPISYAIPPPLSFLNNDLIYDCLWKHALYF